MPAPTSVLAYPMNRRVGPSGEILKRKPWRFDTVGIESKWTRLNVGIRQMRAGNMVYGLFRIGALQRAGVYRKVVMPDRLLFGELSLYGQFTQVPQVLWFRRWNGRVFSLGRQRASFFPGRRPLYSYVPVVDQPRGEPVLDVHGSRRWSTGCVACRRRALPRCSTACWRRWSMRGRRSGTAGAMFIEWLAAAAAASLAGPCGR